MKRTGCTGEKEYYEFTIDQTHSGDLSAIGEFMVDSSAIQLVRTRLNPFLDCTAIPALDLSGQECIIEDVHIVLTIEKATCLRRGYLCLDGHDLLPGQRALGR